MEHTKQKAGSKKHKTNAGRTDQPQAAGDGNQRQNVARQENWKEREGNPQPMPETSQSEQQDMDERF